MKKPIKPNTSIKETETKEYYILSFINKDNYNIYFLERDKNGNNPTIVPSSFYKLLDLLIKEQIITKEVAKTCTEDAISESQKMYPKLLDQEFWLCYIWERFSAIRQCEHKKFTYRRPIENFQFVQSRHIDSHVLDSIHIFKNMDVPFLLDSCILKSVNGEDLSAPIKKYKELLDFRLNANKYSWHYVEVTFQKTSEYINYEQSIANKELSKYEEDLLEWQLKADQDRILELEEELNQLKNKGVNYEL